VPPYACLWLADLPLAAVLRAEPELAGRPLVVCDRDAVVSGWLRGLSLAQARVVAPDLVVRPLALEGMRSAQEALVDVALSVSPAVEDAGGGLAWLDLAGCEALFPSPAGIATALSARLEAVGLEAGRVGIGPTRTVALLAARRGESEIVGASDAQRFLDPLPLDLLEPPEQLAERLTRFGIHTLGALRRLPQRELGARLGEEGVALARRARGEDLAPFRLTPPRARYEEGCACDWSVSNLETLAFLMRGPLERLARRLELRGLGARELYVELELESGRRFASAVGCRASTVEVPVLATLVRLALEQDPPGEPVVRLRIVVTPGGVEPSQLDLFLPKRPAPAELAVTLARLEALVGGGRVGAPRELDSHRPEASLVADFDADAASGPWAGAALPAPALALRALRPPRAIRVFGQDGKPERVEARERDGPHGHVMQCAGPWRLYGEWWGEAPFARDYFDVELEGGGVWRIYHDLDAGGWWADGAYD
jgi:protein ImuB